MEIFMLTVQLFAVGYLPGSDVKYTAQQMDSLTQCEQAGIIMQAMNDMSHNGQVDFMFKCVVRQGV